MVSILPGPRSAFDLIGSMIGQNISNVLPGAVQQGYNRGQLQQSLGKIRQIASNPDSSPLDTILAVMEAGAGIPGSERYLSTLAPEIAKFAEARRAQNITQPGEGGAPVPTMGGQSLAAPGESQQPAEFFPSNVGPQQSSGNLPQAATTGKIIPLLTPGEQRQEAKRLSKQSTEEGIPLTPAQAMEQVQLAEQDKRDHNKIVENERQQRVEAQQTYGQKAVDQLKQVYKGATPEMEAIFQKKGEEEAAKGKSEADINRFLANEAKKFGNSITNVGKEIDAPRWYNAIYRGANGTYKDFQKAGADVRKVLQPILDLGLYDTARAMLQEKGYGVEEREIIINPLSERANTVINKVPSAEKAPVSAVPGKRSLLGINLDLETPQVNLQNIKDGLVDLKQVDPNFSLPLARKFFEDKNYDWRNFKDAFNELIDEGQQLESQGQPNPFKLSDDQTNQQGYLNSPPLSTLEVIMEGLGFIGR